MPTKIIYSTKKPKAEVRLNSLATSSKKSKYDIAIIKKITSLRKNILVTLSLFGLIVLAINIYINVDKKHVAPTSEHILNKVSLGSGWRSEPPTLADMDAKTSGAPFPNPNKVTPASDSFILNLTTIYSRVGAK